MSNKIPNQLLEIFRFASIGIFAVATDFIIYFGLLFFFPSFPTSPTKAFSWICGNIVSFVGNRKFVFFSTNRHPIYQIGPFAILYGSTLLLNNIINELVLSAFGVRIFAWFVATAVAVTINYLGMKFIVFKKNF